MDKLKDVEVAERHVACGKHMAEIHKSLMERKVCYSLEDTFTEACEHCTR